MKSPLQVIADFGCPIDSMIDAIQHFSDREDLTYEQYRRGIQEIIGLTALPETESYHFAKTLFLYSVQETIRAYQTGLIPDMSVVFETAMRGTYQFMENNPWSVLGFNIRHGLAESDTFDPETGEIIPAKPKGAKKEVTERIFADLKSKGASRQDIIEAFVEETGMSRAGATTYFHTLKKEFGFKETEGKKASRTESKQGIAERLYQESPDKSKPIMISLFTEKLGTSKLGAQTYYYACKKKFAPLTETEQ